MPLATQILCPPTANYELVAFGSRLQGRPGVSASPVTAATCSAVSVVGCTKWLQLIVRIAVRMLFAVLYSVLRRSANPSASLPTPARQERQQVEKEVVDIQVDRNSQHDRLALGSTLDSCYAVQVIDKKRGEQNCRNR